MPALLSTTNTQMLPSQTKRKAPDDNPLLNAAPKRAKKDPKVAALSNKRKLAGAEEQAGGLLIVREARLSPPPPFQPAQGPPATTTAGLKPPTKKFRVNSSEPPVPRAAATSTARSDDSVIDPQLENDVRAMDDEADSLRRNSRVALPSVDYSSSSGQPPGLTFATPSRSPSSLNPALQFSAPNSINGKRKGKTKANETVISMFVPLPSDDTPQIARNKRLRDNVMVQYDNRQQRPPTSPSTENSGSGESSSNGGNPRRRSSIGRGKRVSMSFENMGVITQPHNSVSDSSFYKHIDSDLPEPDRLRQLLVWCFSRAAAASTQPPEPSSSPSSSSSNTPLPPLSSAAVPGLKHVQDHVIRLLAERRVDLSLYASGAESSQLPQTENTQNVTNRRWEVTYKTQIEQFSAEDEAWKKTSYDYETHARNVRKEIEKLKSSATASSPAEDGACPAPSEKAKGKRRACIDEAQWHPHAHELSPRFREGYELARSVIGTGAGGTGAMSARNAKGTGAAVGVDEMEAEVVRRLGDLAYGVDYLRFRASSLRTTVETAELMLDARFSAVRQMLDARGAGPTIGPSPSCAGSGGGGGVDVLTAYVRGTREDGSGAPLGVGGWERDPVELLRALSTVDGERPPALVGDAARRAVRVVQRVEESGGVGVVGERKFTGVPATPRKIPGTPRRGNTPARDRER